MRVFVAGASGAIGTRLVPQLIDRGHEVIGTFRSAGKGERLRALGAEPVELDLLEPGAVRDAVLAAKPDAIVHQATALAAMPDLRRFDRSFAQTNRLRTEGTDALLAAARQAGVRRVVAQSFASTLYAREGGPVKTEDDPLDPAPPPAMREAAAAMQHTDRTVREFGGVVLRYGGFYGAPDDGLLEPVRRRQFPIVGGGGGVTSFIHLDDAAAATVLAIERGRTGAYNVVDDEPAPVREWLPVLARVLGAKPPRRVPRWLARLVAGELAVMLTTEARGASNEKARRELGWTPRYPSWRDGFAAAYGPPAPEAGSRPYRPAISATRSGGSPSRASKSSSIRPGGSKTASMRPGRSPTLR
jgi:nucleoside-diphosphate-sugar epimerase